MTTTKMTTERERESYRNMTTTSTTEVFNVHLGHCFDSISLEMTVLGPVATTIPTHLPEMIIKYIKLSRKSS